MTTGLTDAQLLDAYWVGKHWSDRRLSKGTKLSRSLRAVADLAITAQEAESAGLRREIQGLEMRVAELERE